MRIAVIIKKLNVLGGNQRHALGIANELSRRGHEITLYTTQYKKGEGFATIINRFQVISLETQHSVFKKTRNPLVILRRFFEHIPGENKDAQALAKLIDPKTDLLNPHHDPLAYKTAYFYKKYIRDIPSVWVMNDLNTKYASFIRAHAMDSGRTLSLPKRMAYWLFDMWELRFIRAQNAIAVLDKRDADWVKKYFGKHACVVRSGIDADEFPYEIRERRERLANQRGIRLLMVGIFFEHRRFEDGLEAMNMLKAGGYKVNLTIIGDARDKKYYDFIVKRIHDLGLGSEVELRGRVSEEDLRRAYREHDIFIFPSHLQSWGIAVFEAMASGLPVIVSRTAGASDVLTDGENALLVHPKSPKEIFMAVKRLLDEPEFYGKISHNVRNFVEESLSWSRCADQMLDCFRCVITK